MSAFAHSLAQSGLVPDMYRAVEPAYPHEGCGFGFEIDGALAHLPTVNRAQQLHEKDPERYPRGAADWFEPDMKPWLRAQREGGVPRLIYHSHPDVGAYFSQGDYDSAVVRTESGEVVERHPGVHHMVVSVRAGRADGAKLFLFDTATATFAMVAEFDESGALVPGAVA